MSDTAIRPDTPRNLGDRDAPHVSPVTPAEDARSVLINRVSWGAVFAGVVVALVAQLILNMIGVGVGAATLQPGAGADQNPSATGFSIGAAAWWTVSGILAALAGGFTAGRLSGQPKETTAAWHGLTSWALTTLVVFWLLTTTIGTVVGGAYRGVIDAAGGTTRAAGGALQAAAPALAAGDTFRTVEQTMRSALGGNDPAVLRDGAIAAMRIAVISDGPRADDARARTAEALARLQNTSVEEARAQVQRYEEQYRQSVQDAQREATQAADVASRAVSRGALVAAVALLLGGVAAWFGGRLGAVDPTMTGTPVTSRTVRQD
jgi:hypothetical protein